MDSLPFLILIRHERKQDLLSSWIKLEFSCKQDKVFCAPTVAGHQQQNVRDFRELEIENDEQVCAIKRWAFIM